jgi:hypothetical protein
VHSFAAANKVEAAAKPRKAARATYDDAWWRAAMARERAAVAAWNEAAGLDYAAIRRDNDREIAAVEAKNAVRGPGESLRRPKLKDGTGYGAKLRPTAPPIFVSRVAFTFFDYRGNAAKAKAVKEMKVPALCYWPGGVLPPGFTELQVSTGPILPRGTFDYFTSAGYEEDLAIAKQGPSFRYAA